MQQVADRPDTNALPHRGKGLAPFCNPLKPGHFSWGLPLARRLLAPAALGFLVPRILVSALTIWAVGCIIPAPLEAEPTPQQHAPLILSGDPAFGPAIEPTNMSWTVSVTATDENPDDVLYARLYWHNANTYVRLIDDIILKPTTGNQRFGAFSANRFCAFIGTGDQYIWVFVQDTQLPGPDAQPTDLTGRYDSKYWVVNCQ
jgi:hypothetical protein